eukprot:scaffold344628_cov37-Prasinocladus_malaysianus.AAC.1
MGARSQSLTSRGEKRNLVGNICSWNASQRLLSTHNRPRASSVSNPFLLVVAFCLFVPLRCSPADKQPFALIVVRRPVGFAQSKIHQAVWNCRRLLKAS